MSRELAGPPGCPEERELALFVEGSLPEEQRRVVWEHVQGCEACEEVVGTVAHLLEGDSARHDGGTAPAHASGAVISFEDGRPTRPRRRWRGPLVGLAATLIVGSVLYQGQRGPRLASEMLAAGSGAHSLPSAWPDHGWATRGSAAVVLGRESAFRAGAWIVDLEATLSTRDVVRARQAAGELRALLAPVPGCEPSLLYYEQVETALQQHPSDIATARRSASEAETFLASTLDRDALDLGRWIEAAVLAAGAGDRKLLAMIPFERLAGGTTATADPQLRNQLLTVAGVVAGGVTDQELAELQPLLGQIVARSGGS